MERQKDVITVIVPVYNSEEYLDSCISSIVSQTYKQLEIIIVDDGSTDHSREICNKWAEKDQRIRIIRQDNAGVSVARNNGILQSTGEYLAFVDSDDSLKSNSYEVLMCCAKREKVNMVIGKWNIHDIDKMEDRTPEYKVTGRVAARELKKQIVLENENYGGGFPWNRLIHYGAILKKVKQPLLFSEELFVYEDKYWIMQLCDYMEDVYLIDDIIYDYVVRSNSLSHAFSTKKVLNELLAWKYMIDLLGEYAPEELQEIMATYTQLYIRNMWGMRHNKEVNHRNMWKEVKKLPYLQKLNWRDWIIYILMNIMYMGKKK